MDSCTATKVNRWGAVLLIVAATLRLSLGHGTSPSGLVSIS